MFDQVRVVLAGIERSVPRTMLSAMKSMGWQEVQGANPESAQQNKTDSARVGKKQKEKSK
jgi:hypothetical protein